MGLGNRRFFVPGMVVLGLAVVLSGCSASATSGSTNAAAISIGQQAIGFTSSSSTTPTTSGWTSSQTCTPALQANIESGVTDGIALTPADPEHMSGPLSDPNLNSGDVSTCAFTAASASVIQNQEFFVGMPQSYFTTYSTKLTADGFTAGAINVKDVTVTEQIFTRGNDRVVLLYNSQSVGLLAIFG